MAEVEERTATKSDIDELRGDINQHTFSTASGGRYPGRSHTRSHTGPLLLFGALGALTSEPPAGLALYPVSPSQLAIA